MHNGLAAAVFLLTLVGLAAGRLGHLRAPRGAIALVGGLTSAALLGTPWRVVDLDVIALLAGLMVLASLAEDVGMFAPFQRMAYLGPRMSLSAAIVLLAVASALLLNDAAVVTLYPVLLVAVVAAGASAGPSAALLGAATNVGSLLTPFGNPQNAVLAAASGDSILDFLVHQGPVFALAMAGLLGAALLVPVRLRPTIDDETTGRINASAGPNDPPGSASLGHTGPASSAAMFVVGVALVAFVCAAVLGAPLGLSAALAAMSAFVLLRLGGRHVDEVAMRGIDANVLALFFGFYLLAGGIPEWMGGFDLQLSALAKAPLVLVVVAASNTVGNVPATLAFDAVDPVWTAAHAQFLVSVTTLGGTLLLTGSAATLLAAEQARRVGMELTFTEYLRWSWVVVPALLLGAWING